MPFKRAIPPHRVVGAADLYNIAEVFQNVNPLFRFFLIFLETLRSKDSGERLPPLPGLFMPYTFSLFFFISLRLATTMPVRANRAMTLGSTMKLLNMSVTSHTKSLPETVPRKMNTSAMMV